MKKTNHNFEVVLFYCIPIFLVVIRQYYLAAFYVILVSFDFLLSNSKSICNKLREIKNDFNEIKNLKYYYFLDEGKKVDKQKRLNLIEFAEHLTFLFYYINFINTTAFCYLLSQIFASNIWIENTYIFVMTSLGCVTILHQLIKFIYKYTTITYLLIPLLPLLIYLLLNDMFSDITLVFKIMIYLFIVLLLYIMFTKICPAHVLRQLNAKSIILTVLTTMILTLLVYSLTDYFDWFINDSDTLLTLDKVKSIDNVIIDAFIMNNQETINMINSFLKRELFGMLNTSINLIGNSVAISYSIGGMLILVGITRKKKEANLIYRNMLINSSLNYEGIIKCAYLGGQEFENLLFNNDKARDIVLKVEKCNEK